MGATPVEEHEGIEVRVPTLRASRHLRAAIESVLAQTYRDWRLVVQENGPGDPAVRDLLEPYLDDPRVSHVVTGTVLPQAENWNAAIAQARGRYLALLHDDDLWEPSFLEHRIPLLDAHPECGFAFSPHVEIDGDDREIRRRPFVLPAGVNAPEAVVRLLYRGNFIQPPSIVVRRDAYAAVGPAFDPTWPAFIDYEMWMRLAVRFPAIYVRSHDCGWRVHEGSMTARLPHLGEQYLEFAAWLDDIVGRECPEAFDPALSRHKRAYAHVKAALDAAAEGRRRAVLAHIRAAVRLRRLQALDARIPVALLVAIPGPRAAAPLGRLRGFVKRHEVNVHLTEKPI